MGLWTIYRFSHTHILYCRFFFCVCVSFWENRKRTEYRFTMYSTYPPPHAGEILVPLPPQNKSKHPSRRPPAAATRDSLVATEHAWKIADTASAVDHACATRIAAAWRGHVLRRHLATRNITMEFQNAKATKIQCFFRGVVAKRIAQVLRQRREQVACERNASLIEHRLNELKATVKWQASLFDTAARKIQQMFRYKFQHSRMSTVVVTTDGEEQTIEVEEEATPAPNVTKRQYLPRYWRRRSTVVRAEEMDITSDPMSPRKYREIAIQRSSDTPLLEKMMLVPAPPRGGMQQRDSGGESSPTRSLPYLNGSPVSFPPHHNGSAHIAMYNDADALVIRDTQAGGNEMTMLSPQPPSHKRFGRPPPQSTVEAMNARRRRREQEISSLLETEPQQLRIRDRVEGIVQQDFDHCAGVVQRRFRIAQAKQVFHSRQCLSEYQNRYAIIIQSAFRSYSARMHAAQFRRDINEDIALASQRYGTTQVERLKLEYVWNAHVMRRAAVVIQTGYRWYRYLCKHDPEKCTYEEYVRRGPKSLPLGLLQDVPSHKTAAEMQHTEEGRPKYCFRRHKGPEARHVQATKDEEARRQAVKEADERQQAAKEAEEVRNASARLGVQSCEHDEKVVTTPAMGVLEDNAEASYPGIDDDDDGTQTIPINPRDAAATKIQCCFRQRAARAEVQRLKDERDNAFEQAMQDEAARTIQAAHRRRKSPMPNEDAMPPGSSNATPAAATSVLTVE
jgi:hypothetical protein